MEGGLRHGRVPIGHGAVDKDDVLAAGKSSNIQQANSAAYRCAVQENEQLRETNEELLETNEQLKETNEQLKESNEILIEENGFNRQLILVINIIFFAALKCNKTHVHVSSLIYFFVAAVLFRFWKRTTC